MNNWTLVILFAVALLPAKAADRPKSVMVDEQNREHVLKDLVPVLKAYGAVGRIYFSGACAEDTWPFPIFPKVNTVSTQRQGGVAAVREVFRNDKHTKVTQDQSKMIRVTIGQPPIALLQTKLRSIRLDTDEQYNGWRTVDAILNAKEVQAAMQKFGLEKGVKMISGPITLPEKGVPLPHLPTSIKNMTMDQALDLVAKTFGGIVIYETCKEQDGKNLVMLDFVQGAEP